MEFFIQCLFWFPILLVMFIFLKKLFDEDEAIISSLERYENGDE